MICLGKIALLSAGFCMGLAAQGLPAIGSVAPTAVVSKPVFGQALPAAQDGGSTPTPLSVAFNSNVGAGDFVVYATGDYQGPTWVVTDNNADSYVQDITVTNYTGDGNLKVAQGHATGVAGGATTMTSTPASSSYTALAALEFRGLIGVVDGSPSSAIEGVGSTSVACGSVTTSGPGVVVSAIVSYGNTFTAGAGYTIASGAQTGPGGASIAIMYMITSGAGTYSPTATAAGAVRWNCTTVAYK
jgi:hypothetical protein